MDAICTIDVEATAPGAYRVGWDEQFSRAPVDIFAGPAPHAIATDHALARKVASGAVVRVAGPRPYFLLRAADGATLIAAQRNVPLPGSINFRDLGGYASSDGRRVKWGTLFRSGHMANLTADASADFAALGIRTVCDFRVVEERAAEAGSLPADTRLEILGITPGIGDRFFFHRLFASTDDPAKVVDAIHAMMRALVVNAAPRYARLFELLLEQPAGATLINCSAGKERTGLASVLLLTALGVPRATIAYDFMLSQRYFPAAAEVPRVLQKYAVRATGAAAASLIRPLLETRESYLQSAFAAIDEQYGSGAGMLAQLYGLGPAECGRLRDYFTI